MAAVTTPQRQRRPSTNAPVDELQGPIGPPGVSRPKHKRTVTGLGPAEIKSYEAEIPDSQKAAYVAIWRDRIATLY